MNVQAEDYSFDELLWEREWRKCAPSRGGTPNGKWHERTPDELLEGFGYFCENYWYIRHPERGRIKFELFEPQVETVELWLKSRYVADPEGTPDRVLHPHLHVTFWLTFFYPTAPSSCCRGRNVKRSSC